MTKVRVLIADDHAVVREGLRTLIANAPALELAGEAANGQEALDLARSLRPDVVIMDLVMPQMDGQEAIRAILGEMPGVRILVLTSFTDREKVVQAIQAGAVGYLLKDSSPQQLVQAVLDVHQGENVLPPSVAARLIQGSQEQEKLGSLTGRELEILKLLTQGLTDQEIATQLTISEWTVHTHVRRVLEKLELSNRTQAAVYALRSGVVKF